MLLDGAMRSSRPTMPILLLAVACNSSPLPTTALSDGGVESDAAARICVNLPFPTFDKACVNDSDCVAVEHQTDCCGTLVAIGIRTSERARFEAAEASCRAAYPGCGCASRPTKTEDGSTLLWNDSLGVLCAAGACTTFNTACGAPCTGGRTCLTCPVHLTTYGACSAPCATDADCKDPALPSCLMGYAGTFCAAAGTACGSK